MKFFYFFSNALPTKISASSNGPLCGKHFWVSVFNFRYLLRKDRSPRWWITTLSSAVEINSWPTKSPAGQPWKATQTLGDKLIQVPRCERVNPVDTLHQCSLQGVTQVISYTNIQTTNLFTEQTEAAKSQTKAHMCSATETTYHFKNYIVFLESLVIRWLWTYLL